jgi:hypothetical protein
MSEAFTRNDLIGLAELFRLAVQTNPHVIPGVVPVALSPDDCVRIADILTAEIERRWMAVEA